MPVLAVPFVSRLDHASGDRLVDDRGIGAASRLGMGGFAGQLTGRRLNLLGFKERHGAAVQDDFQNADDDGARDQGRHGSRRARYVADIDEVEAPQRQ